VRQGVEGGVLSSGHPDTAGGSEIRKIVLSVGSTIPEAIPPSAAIATAAFHKTRTNFSFAADPQPDETDKWRSPPLARTKSPFDPRRITVHRPKGDPSLDPDARSSFRRKRSAWFFYFRD